jgi:kynurenine formamidase
VAQLIDVSHAIEHGMVTYKGLPAPVISDHLSRENSRGHYASGTEFHIGRIEMVANTGTYLDSPFHRYEDGRDLAELPLESLANLDGIAVRIDGDATKAITSSVFEGCDVNGKAVIVHTGWAKHWRSENYFENHPFLTLDAVEYLVAGGAALVGIDSYNIDDTRDGTRPAHSVLLKANIPIVEHLCNLQALPDGDFKFFAVPVKVKKFGTFPMRAFAIVGG